MEVYNEDIEKLIIFDIKLCEEKDISSLADSVDRMMKRYELEKGDYENSDLAKSVFSRLNWSKGSKDIINSFWGTFTCALVSLSEDKGWTYSIVSKGRCTDSVYSFDDNFNIKYCSWNPKTKAWESFSLSKKVFGGKYVPDNIHYDKTQKLLEEFQEFQEFSSINDSIANFMSCPDYPYNIVKGCLPDVKDYLNLMVDKIQACIDSKEDLICFNVKNKHIIKLEKLIDWKNWFIENQKKYHLVDYYFVENNKIEGIPLFKNQSLSKPMPLTNEEVRSCIEEIIRRIKNRRNSILNDLK